MVVKMLKCELYGRWLNYVKERDKLTMTVK